MKSWGEKGARRSGSAWKSARISGAIFAGRMLGAMYASWAMGDGVSPRRNKALGGIMKDGFVDLGIGIGALPIPGAPIPEMIRQTAKTSIEEGGFGWLSDPSMQLKMLGQFTGIVGQEMAAASRISGIAAGLGFGVGLYAGAVEYAADSAFDWWKNSY